MEFFGRGVIEYLGTLLLPVYMVVVVVPSSFFLYILAVIQMNVLYLSIIIEMVYLCSGVVSISIKFLSSTFI